MTGFRQTTLTYPGPFSTLGEGQHSGDGEARVASGIMVADDSSAGDINS